MRRRARRTLRHAALPSAAVLAAGLISAGVVTPSVATAASPGPCAGLIQAHPKSTAFFTNPLSKARADHDRITHAMTSLVCSVTQVPAKAKHHPTIELAMYLFNTAPGSDGIRDDGAIGQLVKALIWAQNTAHARVRVVFDGGVPQSSYPAPNPAYTLLHNPASGLKRPSQVVVCTHNPHDTACAGDNIMHSKLLLVSQTGRHRKPAMIVTSQNLTPEAENNTYNNAVQLVGGRAAFTRYHHYFKTLLTVRRHPNLGAAMSATRPHRIGSAAVSSFFFPRNDPSFHGRIKKGPNAGFPKEGGTDTPHQDARVDTVAKTLARVTNCIDPGTSPTYLRVKHALNHMPHARTLIQIAMYQFHDRPQITRQLQRLIGEGCDVQLVYSETDVDTFQQLAPLQGPSFRMWQGVRPDVHNPDFPVVPRCVFVHSKYLLVSGSVDGQPNQNLVVTGSENWNAPGLHRNDESMVAIREHRHAPIYRRFATQFSNVDRPQARRPNARGVAGCLLYTSPGLLDG
jgi:phosphatidylserine/phosphatidylglycerophosphate/cardiolipin synthase-like enzyme